VTALCDRLNGSTRAVLPGGDKPTGTLRDRAVKILPMHSARGLQFRIVLLLWADLLPSPFKSHYDGIDRGLLYVVMARAEDMHPAFRQLVLRRGALPRVGNGASVPARRSVRSIRRSACEMLGRWALRYGAQPLDAEVWPPTPCWTWYMVKSDLQAARARDVKLGRQYGQRPSDKKANRVLAMHRWACPTDSSAAISGFPRTPSWRS
jgi:hypothetical protein